MPRSLILTHDRETFEVAETEIDAIPALREQRGEWVVVFSDDEVGTGSFPSDSFRVFHRKGDGRGLAAVLLGCDRCAVIPVEYSSPRRLLQGIRPLLEAARRAGERNAYILLVDGAVFKRACRTAVCADGGSDPPPVSPPPMIASGNREEALLADLGAVPGEHPLRERMVGCSLKMELVRRLVLKAAESDVPVLVVGESGTGKEEIARQIHFARKGGGAALVAVNCAAIPEKLLESELFGTAKGAFTSAVPRVGLWEKANGGTLFLDEVGDLSPVHQAKILRALQEKVIFRVGGREAIPVSARIVAATHRDLFKAAEEGGFREDLLYRLHGMLIATPDFDGQPEDIAPIARHLWRRIAGGRGGGMSDAAVGVLHEFRWPGNVRQLRAALAAYATFYGPGTVDPRRLRLLIETQFGMAVRPADNGAKNCGENESRRVLEKLRHLEKLAVCLSQTGLLLGRSTEEVAPARTNVGLMDAREGLARLLQAPLLFHRNDLFEDTLRLHQALGPLIGKQSGTGASLLPLAESLLERVFEAEKQLRNPRDRNVPSPETGHSCPV